MTTKKLSLYKNLPVNVDIEKSRYYPYSQQIITNSSKTLDINLSIFEGLDYSFNDSKMTFNEKVLWNGYNFTGCERYLAPYFNGNKTIYNITTVGNVYINNGIAKGFTTSNYLVLDNKYKSNNNAEYVFKFTTGSSFSASQVVAHCEYFINIEIATDKNVTFYNWGSNVSTTLFTATTNTTYWVKILVNGTSKTYSYSTDGVTFTGDVTVTDSGLQPSNTNYQFRLGLSSYNSSNPFLGSIDISQTYIKVNNEIFWQLEESIVPNVANYLTNVKELVYNVVGNPTIVDNVVSNFSSSNYITTDYTFLPNNYSWVWQVKFMQTESYTSDVQYIMNSSHYKNSPYITILSDGTINATLSSNGSYLAGVATSDFVVELNKYYWLQLEFDGVDTYSLKYSTDGQNYSLIGEVQNTTLIVSTDKLWFGKTGHNSYLHGTIDFNETFVEVNNEVVWGKDALHVKNVIGCLDNITDIPTERVLSAFVKDDYVLLSESDDDKDGYTWANTVTIPQHDVLQYYKVNYNTVGSINYDTDFNASGFSGSNYLTSKDIINLNNYNTWSLEAKVKIDTLSKYQYWNCGMFAIGFDRDNYLHYFGDDTDFKSTQTFTNNTWYWFKLEKRSESPYFNGTQYVMYYKLNEEDDWIDCGSKFLETNSTYQELPLYIGVNPNNTAEYLYGTIDMKTYKVYGNGALIYKTLELV